MDAIENRSLNDVSPDKWDELLSASKMRGIALVPDEPKLPEGARKDDAGKLRYDLVPLSFMEGDAEVLSFGAQKYALEGWRQVPSARERYFAALMRHLFAYYYKGEECDPESGLHHMKHVRTNAGFLLELASTQVASH